jgi:hypothetical protein
MWFATLTRAIVVYKQSVIMKKKADPLRMGTSTKFRFRALILVLQPHLAGRAVVGAGLLYDTNRWHVGIAFYSKNSQYVRDDANPPIKLWKSLSKKGYGGLFPWAGFRFLV